ncbi:MAG: TonB-dependent receptor [Gemmatimonadaceae bacterium]|nr:TonB-dependent receptor [Gemmatimonadaceae bacterium]
MLPALMLPLVNAFLLVGLSLVFARSAPAQRPDSTARLRVRVTHEGAPVADALVRAGRLATQTDSAGEARLVLPAGSHHLVVSRIGFQPHALTLSLLAGADTTIRVAFEAAVAEMEAILVSATRNERRVEDLPLRVEVIDEEEVAEKVSMTPGDIAMMLNETAGLRVQVTNPSLGGANVRMQGLLGRYSLLLADGLPLYGGQAGGLGLLQVPPVDLGRVEVIKGAASSLYGPGASGGVVNLISRRPEEQASRTLLVNQTSRGGTDGVVFVSAPLTERIGYTLLAGMHRQLAQDVDDDAWIDVPGYRRVVVRPRGYFDDGAGRTAFVTAGFTGEGRDGGTRDGRVAPDGRPFAEGLRTRRADAGALARWLVRDSTSAWHGAIVTLRGSAMRQRHEHTFGPVREDDVHRTAFGEASVAVPRGAATWVGGVAWQQDAYRSRRLPMFDYTFTIPAVFAQVDVDAASWLVVSTSARVDAHNVYGTAVNPRASLLARRPADGMLAGWSTRASAGLGSFAPTPFTDETEVTGLSALVPLSGLVAERVVSASFDVGGPIALTRGRIELQATAFGSRVRRPLQVLDAPAGAVDRFQLVNAGGPTHTWGGELLGRLVRPLGADDDAPALRVTATYTYLRSRECDVDVSHARGCPRREVPLTPRHAAGLVASVEQEGRSRVGLEVYHTGRQALHRNPYRAMSRPYVIVGVLGERAVTVGAATARLFINFENLTNVRQTRYDPLLLPSRGPGGRWTTDAWTDLAGFTMNGGVRLVF